MIGGHAGGQPERSQRVDFDRINRAALGNAGRGRRRSGEPCRLSVRPAAA